MEPQTKSVPVTLHLARSAPAAAILLLAACHGSVTVHPHPVPPPPPPPPIFDEGEPNDTAWQAPWFGSLYPSEQILVQGYATDDGSDPQDGLAFTCFGASRIDFTLYVDDPWTDLDVWLFDPALNQFVAAFDLPFGDESGTFWLAGTQEFQLVVVPASGASPWTLSVESSPGYGLPPSPEKALPELAPSLRDYGASESETPLVAE